jgi:hypothetical protein
MLGLRIALLSLLALAGAAPVVPAAQEAGAEDLAKLALDDIQNEQNEEVAADVEQVQGKVAEAEREDKAGKAETREQGGAWMKKAVVDVDDLLSEKDSDVEADAPAEPKAADAPAEPKAVEAVEAVAEPKAVVAPAEPKAVDAVAEPKAADAPAEPKAVEAVAEPEAADVPAEPKVVDAVAEPKAADAPAEPKAVQAKVQEQAAEKPTGAQQPVPKAADTDTMPVKTVQPKSTGKFLAAATSKSSDAVQAKVEVKAQPVQEKKKVSEVVSKPVVAASSAPKTPPAPVPKSAQVPTPIAKKVEKKVEKPAAKVKVVAPAPVKVLAGVSKHAAKDTSSSTDDASSHNNAIAVANEDVAALSTDDTNSEQQGQEEEAGERGEEQEQTESVEAEREDAREQSESADDSTEEQDSQQEQTENNDDSNQDQAEEQDQAESTGESTDDSAAEGGATLIQKPRRVPNRAADFREFLDPIPMSHLAAGRVLRGKASTRKMQAAANDLKNFVDNAGEAEVQQDAEDTDSLEKQTARLKQEVEDQVSDVASAPAPGPAPGPSPGPSPAPAPIDPYKMCNELCKHDTGMDGDFDFCVVDCRTYVDAGNDIASLFDFVTDETYNEQGGESMEEHFEKATGKKIPDCKPSIDVGKVPTFEMVDTSQDGKISRKEMEEWAVKACVPDEIAHQIFDIADSSYDQHIDAAEWKAIGENTSIEELLDSFADKLTQGEDQYEPVQLPAFRHLDTSKDGELDKEEIMKLFKDEIKRRIPTMSSDDVNGLAKQYEEDIMKDVMKLDLDGDQTINEVEFGYPHSGGMGRELWEAAQNPNNLPDPDDLSRNPGGPSPGPATPGGIASPAPASF